MNWSLTAYLKNQMERFDLPQIALAGRSNVGKSSLINCLAGQKKLAKISSTPGKTRSLNYYRVHPDGFMLVDLPGYGYAKCSKTERDKWAKLIDHYLKTTPSLAAVAMLIDSRHDPQKNDLDLASYLVGLGIPALPVLTKADKCKQRDQAKRTAQWREILRTGSDPVLVSAKTGQGKDKLWNTLARIAGTITSGETAGNASSDPAD